ncbi:MAG: hypothetical protein A2984_02085 [Omnitrophica WOR_2 bacterium RIFCSPLOWO2_01_FULL_41_12]|nr:MAG: hypothetical protein A2984_02085 [Omnitrophica WOR_2 bacterium RIFCSPLOWO2_01_FULL_41_12]
MIAILASLFGIRRVNHIFITQNALNVLLSKYAVAIAVSLGFRDFMVLKPEEKCIAGNPYFTQDIFGTVSSFFHIIIIVWYS